MPKLEVDLQEKVIARIKEVYGENVWVYKVHDAVRVGVPDLKICLYGHFIAIELKRGKKKGSPLQEYNIKRIQRAGGMAFVSNNLEEILERLSSVYPPTGRNIVWTTSRHNKHRRTNKFSLKNLLPSTKT